MTLLDPYLVFPGQTREAMTLYQSVLGGELTVVTFGDMGMAEPDGTVDPTAVMHSLLVTDGGLRLMASDGPPGEEVRRGNDFALALNGSLPDRTELLRWYEALAAAGTVDVPFGEQPWGWFGQVTDPYGVAWMFNLDTEDAAPA